MWLFAGILLTFGLIAFGGINMLIMHAAMPTALHQIKKPEKYADKVIRKAWVYAKDMRFTYLISTPLPFWRVRRDFDLSGFTDHSLPYWTV